MHRSFWLNLSIVFAAAAISIGCQLEDNEALPAAVSSHDSRLALSLFASDPDIVTPIGIAIDENDRIFVLESHTHTPPSDYDGPPADLIKVFTDEAGEGLAGPALIFADGIVDGMNMAFSPAGELYVAASKAVLRLTDTDDDLVADRRDTVLALVEPSEVYDHAALLGIAFSPDGWLYLSRGNTGGRGWKLEGTDGSWVAGYGDGGNIIRSRPDGSDVREVATGFWNPFGLEVHRTGRLLALDNDPDSRGPNRLVDVIEGGDFGYKSLYGGSGIHPYLAWNGELPGTLPMAVAIGEAPSGLLDASLASLPAEYGESLLASIWEESRIVRIDLRPNGVSVTGETHTIVTGDETFRPVSFAVNSRGVIYFTDWVKRSYPNHGSGRIWRLGVRTTSDARPPRQRWKPTGSDPGAEQLATIYAISDTSQTAALFEAIESGDPFLQTAARQVLKKLAFRDQLVKAVHSASSEVRLQAAVALQGLDLDDAARLARELLFDQDPEVRETALVWIGRRTLHELLPDVETAFTRGLFEGETVETYLATIRHLQPVFYEAYPIQSELDSKKLKRRLPAGYVAAILEDESISEATRAMVVPYLESPAQHIGTLAALLDARNERLRQAALHALAGIRDDAAAEALRSVAVSESAVHFRSEAIASLARQQGDFSTDIARMIDDESPDIRLEAVRYLRAFASKDSIRVLLQDRLDALRAGDRGDAGFVGQLELALGDYEVDIADKEGWLENVPSEGHVARGRRVFYSPQGQCSSCHRIDNRGGTFGPDLTHVGESKTRSQIARSIVFPSEEVTPEWQGWYVRTEDGVTHTGRQIDVGFDSVELLTLGGDFEEYDDVLEYGVLPVSLMPESVHINMTTYDFADLLAFLEEEK